MSGNDSDWDDADSARLVRPYTMTRGRTTSHRADLEMITLVVALGSVGRQQARAMQPESVRIVELTQQPMSVAEIAAALRLPLSVTKILIADLMEQRLVAARAAATPNLHVLQAVINGIQRI